VDEQLLKIEARQKEIMARYDMPHSPLRAPMDFPPPPKFYNPWEEMGGPSMMFGAPQVDEDEIEEDLVGVRSRMRKKKRIFLLPTYPQMRKKKMTMMMTSNGYGRVSPFWRLMPKGE
jgi:hypothetical protein